MLHLSLTQLLLDHPVENYYLNPRNCLPSFKAVANLNPNLGMNVGHFLDIRHTQTRTKKKYPFKVAAHLSCFISAAVMLIIFGLQLTKQQRNFKPIS